MFFNVPVFRVVLFAFLDNYVMNAKIRSFIFLNGSYKISKSNQASNKNPKKDKFLSRYSYRNVTSF